VSRESIVINGRVAPALHLRQGDVLFGLAHNFGGGERRFRVEAGAGYRVAHRASSVYTLKENGFEGSAGFAYRSHWGIVHITVSYTAP
jgi:hypothetical protein